MKFFLTQNDLAWITAIFCFKKYDNFLHIFFKKLNFGLLAWFICLSPELFDIGGSESIIWSPPSSNGLIIRPLLALGGRKNFFFLSGVGGWNNHLHLVISKVPIFFCVWSILVFSITLIEKVFLLKKTLFHMFTT